MTILLLLGSVTLLFTALLMSLPGSIGIYRHFMRGHFVDCPENHQQSTVAVSAGLAATTSAIARPVLVVTACALWPLGHRCSRKCIQQIRWTEP